jgi:hypothetical protein
MRLITELRRNITKPSPAPGWIWCKQAVASANHLATFDAFIAANADLTDENALHAYYSPERLASVVARQEWAPPDLRSLPSKSTM